MDKETLLIVEDEDVLLGALKLRYARKYDVVSARNVEEATQVVTNQKNDIKAAVVDLWMPLKNSEPIDEAAGLRLISVMRGTDSAEGIAPLIPVIILTGHSSADTAREGLELNAQWHVIKLTDGWLDKLDKYIAYAIEIGRAMNVLDLVDPLKLQLRHPDKNAPSNQAISDAGLELLAEMLHDLRRQFGV